MRFNHLCHATGTNPADMLHGISGLSQPALDNQKTVPKSAMSHASLYAQTLAQTHAQSKSPLLLLTLVV